MYSSLSRQDTLPAADPSWSYQGQPAWSSLSRQDTLPSENPLWSYSQVQGQPSPIPPRNEPLLYIPNNVDGLATALKNLQPRVPPTTFESLNGTDGTTDKFGKEIRRSMGSVPEVRTIIDGPFLSLQRSFQDSFNPKPCSHLDDALLLSRMTLLTIHGTLHFIY
jgi:hypothetical protein